MHILEKLERRFGHLAVPNVALALIGSQLLVYVLIITGQVGFNALALAPQAILSEGEWWRVFSFIIAPPWVAQSAFGAVFLAFFWYVFWLMSSALESAWGVFRFNLYLLLGIVFTLLGAFAGHLIAASPPIVVQPGFLYLSVFLAFATLHPEFEFYLFLVLPVKVKWLAYIVTGITAFSVLAAPSMGYRLAILAQVFNYLLFFGRELRQIGKARQRRARYEAQKEAEADQPFHTCSRCGATDKTHPDRGFRYRNENGELVAICDVCREDNSKAEG